MRASSIGEVVSLYERWGGDHYDEELSQLAHAEQSAALAVRDGASDALVAAALLHDVGHLLHLETGEDRPHERSGPAYLAGLFPAALTGPIALHVEAKRYLCATEPEYAATLSAGSIASLVAQGGPMSPPEVAAFVARPTGADAVALRRWDDAGKVDGLTVAPFRHYLDLLRDLARRS